MAVDPLLDVDPFQVFKDLENILTSKRLHDKGASAQLISLIDLFEIGQAGKHDDDGSLGMPLLCKGAEDIEAGQGSHDQVEQEDARENPVLERWLAREIGETFFPGFKEFGRI